MRICNKKSTKRAQSLTSTRPIKPFRIDFQSSAMPDTWYRLLIPEGVDVELPGIYEWRIKGAGSYIGRYTYNSRPFGDYARHVRAQFAGGIYKPSQPDGWRRIHRELYAALLDGREIELIFVENCPLSELNARERIHRKERGTLNGRRRTLEACRRPKPQRGNS